MAATAPAGLGLELRDLRVAFSGEAGPARLLLDVPEWKLAPGAQVALCGRSGSGKTTLLNVLAGIERPARGAVRWGAVTISALPERTTDRWRRETLGLVFQQFHLFPGMSALENVLLPLRFDRWSIAPAIRAAARELLDRVGVGVLADVRVLSRGEQQRVALARALLRRPAIVLADEPTASLDPDNAAQVADLLCAMCAGVGATLVVATHDPQLAERLGGIVDIADGTLRQRFAASWRPQLVPAA